MKSTDMLDELKEVVKAANLWPFYEQYFEQIGDDLWRLEDLDK